MLDVKSAGIRYWLWFRNVQRSEWIDMLALWANCSKDRARLLLDGAYLTAEEQQRLAQEFEVEEARVQNPFSEVELNVLAENLRFLLYEIKGEEIAAALGVDTNTISRWKNGRQPPRMERLTALKDFLGVPPELNLCEDMLFLSLEPMSNTQRRIWLQKRVSEMRQEDIRELFPALRKLLKEE